MRVSAFHHHHLSLSLPLLLLLLSPVAHAFGDGVKVAFDSVTVTNNKDTFPAPTVRVAGTIVSATGNAADVQSVRVRIFQLERDDGYSLDEQETISTSVTVTDAGNTATFAFDVPVAYNGLYVISRLRLCPTPSSSSGCANTYPCTMSLSSISPYFRVSNSRNKPASPVRIAPVSSGTSIGASATSWLNFTLENVVLPLDEVALTFHAQISGDWPLVFSPTSASGVQTVTAFDAGTSTYQLAVRVPSDALSCFPDKVALVGFGITMGFQGFELPLSVLTTGLQTMVNPGSGLAICALPNTYSFAPIFGSTYTGSQFFFASSSAVYFVNGAATSPRVTPVHIGGSRLLLTNPPSLSSPHVVVYGIDGTTGIPYYFTNRGSAPATPDGLPFLLYEPDTGLVERLHDINGVAYADGLFFVTSYESTARVAACNQTTGLCRALIYDSCPRAVCQKEYTDCATSQSCEDCLRTCTAWPEPLIDDLTSFADPCPGYFSSPVPGLTFACALSCNEKDTHFSSAPYIMGDVQSRAIVALNGYVYFVYANTIFRVNYTGSGTPFKSSVRVSGFPISSFTGGYLADSNHAVLITFNIASLKIECTRLTSDGGISAIRDGTMPPLVQEMGIPYLSLSRRGTKTWLWLYSTSSELIIATEINSDGTFINPDQVIITTLFDYRGIPDRFPLMPTSIAHFAEDATALTSAATTSPHDVLLSTLPPPTTDDVNDGGEDGPTGPAFEVLRLGCAASADGSMFECNLRVRGLNITSTGVVELAVTCLEAEAWQFGFRTTSAMAYTHVDEAVAGPLVFDMTFEGRVLVAGVHAVPRIRRNGFYDDSEGYTLYDLSRMGSEVQPYFYLNTSSTVPEPDPPTSVISATHKISGGKKLALEFVLPFPWQLLSLPTNYGYMEIRSAEGGLPRYLSIQHSGDNFGANSLVAISASSVPCLPNDTRFVVAQLYIGHSGWWFNSELIVPPALSGVNLRDSDEIPACATADPAINLPSGTSFFFSTGQSVYYVNSSAVTLVASGFQNMRLTKDGAMSPYKVAYGVQDSGGLDKTPYVFTPSTYYSAIGTSSLYVRGDAVMAPLHDVEAIWYGNDAGSTMYVSREDSFSVNVCNTGSGMCRPILFEDDKPCGFFNCAEEYKACELDAVCRTCRLQTSPDAFQTGVQPRPLAPTGSFANSCPANSASPDNAALAALDACLSNTTRCDETANVQTSAPITNKKSVRSIVKIGNRVFVGPENEFIYELVDEWGSVNQATTPQAKAASKVILYEHPQRIDGIAGGHASQRFLFFASTSWTVRPTPVSIYTLQLDTRQVVGQLNVSMCTGSASISSFTASSDNRLWVQYFCYGGLYANMRLDVLQWDFSGALSFEQRVVELMDSSDMPNFANWRHIVPVSSTAVDAPPPTETTASTTPAATTTVAATTPAPPGPGLLALECVGGRAANTVNCTGRTRGIDATKEENPLTLTIRYLDAVGWAGRSRTYIVSFLHFTEVPESAGLGQLVFDFAIVLDGFIFNGLYAIERVQLRLDASYPDADMHMCELSRHSSTVDPYFHVSNSADEPSFPVSVFAASTRIGRFGGRTVDGLQVNFTLGVPSTLRPDPGRLEMMPAGGGWPLSISVSGRVVVDEPSRVNVTLEVTSDICLPSDTRFVAADFSLYSSGDAGFSGWSFGSRLVVTNQLSGVNLRSSSAIAVCGETPPAVDLPTGTSMFFSTRHSVYYVDEMGDVSLVATGFQNIRIFSDNAASPLKVAYGVDNVDGSELRPLLYIFGPDSFGPLGSAPLYTRAEAGVTLIEDTEQIVYSSASRDNKLYVTDETDVVINECDVKSGLCEPLLLREHGSGGVYHGYLCADEHLACEQDSTCRACLLSCGLLAFETPYYSHPLSPTFENPCPSSSTTPANAALAAYDACQSRVAGDTFVFDQDDKEPIISSSAKITRVGGLIYVHQDKYLFVLSDIWPVVDQSKTARIKAVLKTLVYTHHLSIAGKAAKRDGLFMALGSRGATDTEVIISAVSLESKTLVSELTLASSCSFASLEAMTATADDRLWVTYACGGGEKLAVLSWNAASGALAVEKAEVYSTEAFANMAEWRSIAPVGSGAGDAPVITTPTPPTTPGAPTKAPTGAPTTAAPTTAAPTTAAPTLPSEFVAYDFPLDSSDFLTTAAKKAEVLQKLRAAVVAKGFAESNIVGVSILDEKEFLLGVEVAGGTSSRLLRTGSVVVELNGVEVTVQPQSYTPPTPDYRVSYSFALDYGDLFGDPANQTLLDEFADKVQQAVASKAGGRIGDGAILNITVVEGSVVAVVSVLSEAIQDLLESLGAIIVAFGPVVASSFPPVVSTILPGASTAPAPPPAATSAASSDSSGSVDGIVGGVIGGLLVIILVAIVVVLLLRRKREQERRDKVAAMGAGLDSSVVDDADTQELMGGRGEAEGDGEAEVHAVSPIFRDSEGDVGSGLGMMPNAIGGDGEGGDRNINVNQETNADSAAMLARIRKLYEKTRESASQLEKSNSKACAQTAEQREAGEKTLSELEREQRQTAERIAQLQRQHALAVEQGSGGTLALAGQLSELQEDNALLMEEYEERQRVVKAQKELQSHPSLAVVYRTLQTKLNETLLAFKVLASGQVGASKRSKKDAALNMVRLAGESLPLPVLGHALENMGTHTNRWSAKKRTRQAGKISDELGVSVTQVEATVEELARRFTLAFREQVQVLTEASAREFAERVVGMVLHVLQEQETSSDSMPDHVLDVLLNGTQPLRSVCKNSALRLERQESRAGGAGYGFASGLWTDHGLLRLSGVRTEDYRFFVTRRSDVELYGFRAGTVGEALAMGWREIDPPPRELAKMPPEHELDESVRERMRQRRAELEAKKKAELERVEQLAREKAERKQRELELKAKGEGGASMVASAEAALQQLGLADSDDEDGVGEEGEDPEARRRRLEAAAARVAPTAGGGGGMFSAGAADQAKFKLMQSEWEQVGVHLLSTSGFGLADDTLKANVKDDTRLLGILQTRPGACLTFAEARAEVQSCIEGLPESYDIYVPFRSKLAKIHRKAYNNVFLLSKDIYLLSHDLE